MKETISLYWDTINDRIEILEPDGTNHYWMQIWNEPIVNKYSGPKWNELKGYRKEYFDIGYEYLGEF